MASVQVIGGSANRGENLPDALNNFPAITNEVSSNEVETWESIGNSPVYLNMYSAIDSMVPKEVPYRGVYREDSKELRKKVLSRKKTGDDTHNVLPLFSTVGYWRLTDRWQNSLDGCLTRRWPAERRLGQGQWTCGKCLDTGQHKESVS